MKNPAPPSDPIKPETAALRLLDDQQCFPEVVPELPVLHLGAMTSLRRRDIYTND
jgi:hypothetical protein